MRLKPSFLESTIGKQKKLQTPGKSDTIKKISMEKGKRNMEVTFESLGLSEAMLKALEEKGYAVFLRKG